MRIINALLANWNSKTTTEKIKTVLHGIIMIGGGVIGAGIGDKFSEGRSKLEGFCVHVTGMALGSVVAESAVKSMDESIDQIEGLINDRKNREGTANA